MIVNSLDELIGATPLMRLKNVSDEARGVNVFGKVEWFNPCFSIKDRSARELLEQARLDGKLKPGYTVVESSSGNMGHALAMLCALYGYHFVCVLDPKTPKNNIALVQAYGGSVEIVTEPDESGSFQQKRIAIAKSIAQRTPNCVNLDQYSNPAALDAHSNGTAPEIYEALEGKVDAVISCVSTGSHLSGIGRYFKEKSPQTKIIGVEPEGSVVFGGAYRPFLQNGTGLSFVPGNYLAEYVDETVKVSDHDAFYYCHKMAREEGLLFGGSSGSVISAAHAYALKQERPANIVVICADAGLKYLETVYNHDWLAEHGIFLDTASRERTVA